MSSWTSYPKIWNLGHPQAKDLFRDPVVVQEKIDGSQFSFGAIAGELKIKSKSAFIDPLNPPQMFKSAVETVQRLFDEGKLRSGWTYRGEVLSKPKHNVLAYDRVPAGNIILFDIAMDYESYAAVDVLQEEGARLGLEVVPCFVIGGTLTKADDVRQFLDRVSVLGGQKIEGVVIKNYYRFGIDGKQLMGKYVSEAFKEVHHGEWRAMNPTKGDIIDQIADAIVTPARWHKAVQHLREAGKLTDSPKDIGDLIKEVIADTKTEEEQYIKDRLFAYAWKVIGRRLTNGLPEWYKQQLLEKQFGQSIDVIETEPYPPLTILTPVDSPLEKMLDGATAIVVKEE